MKDHTGKQYGRLTVVSFTGKDKSGNCIWKCICSCGKSTFSQAGILPRRKSCGCQRQEDLKKRKTKSGSAFRRLFDRYQDNAQSRGIEFCLTPDDVRALTKMPCFYCGIEPSQIMLSQSGESYVYNGIDRADNNRGYLLSNCVPCCGFHNRMKGAMSQQSFIEAILRMADFMRNVDATIFTERS